MYSEGHKHVTDVKLDSIVMLLDRILDYLSWKNDKIIIH